MSIQESKYRLIRQWNEQYMDIQEFSNKKDAEWFLKDWKKSYPTHDIQLITL